MSENRALSEAQAREAKQIAELEVRRYFDHYLTRIFPQQVAAVVEAHNLSPKSHGGVERKFTKMVWLTVGAASAGGSGIGYAISTLLPLVG